MSSAAPHLQIAPAPHVRQDVTSTRLMYEVLLATLPIVAFATWQFGPCAPLLVLASSSPRTVVAPRESPIPVSLSHP